MKSVLILLCLTVAAVAAEDTKGTPLMTRELAGIAGKEGTMVTVEYAPGASSAEHRRNAYTFVYVLEGSVVMRVKNGKEVTLGPGQTFYESPDDIHTVSRNASSTRPGKVFGVFRQGERNPIHCAGKVSNDGASRHRTTSLSALQTR